MPVAGSVLYLWGISILDMKIISRGKFYKRSLLLYRKVRYRKGHGVHSPFAYNFITKVIDERAVYYCENDIELTRKKISYPDQSFFLPAENGQGEQRISIHEIMKKIAIKPKNGALLLRMTNYFKPRNILQVGEAVGFSTLYLSSYSSDVQVLVLEEHAGRAALCRAVFEKHKANNIQLQEGPYYETLPVALADREQVDFVYLDFLNSTELNTYVIDQCLSHLHDQSVLVVSGIKTTKEKKEFWKHLCFRPEVSVTVDVYEFGIVFFNKKLHKRNYIVSF